MQAEVTNSKNACAEFQERLPELMDAPQAKVMADPHARECRACGALVGDLFAIATESRDLPQAEPSDRLWHNVRASLLLEGVIKESSAPAPVVAQPARHWWGAPRWSWAAAAAVLLMGVALSIQNAPWKQKPEDISNINIPTLLDDTDMQVLAEVEARQPEMRQVYEANLKNVNGYIRDAQATLQAEPGNEEAGAHVREAYAQKTMLYAMATSRSQR